ncbi:hypothetical protein ES705_25104 [subsurface metagenome]
MRVFACRKYVLQLFFAYFSILVKELEEFLECDKCGTDVAITTAPDFSDIPIPEIVFDVSAGDFKKAFSLVADEVVEGEEADSLRVL